MTVQTVSKLDELQPYVQELADLSSLEHPTRVQNMRMTSLMSIISAIKGGQPASEIRNAEMESLRLAAGLPRLPERACSSPLGEKLESEWRRFGLTGECRETHIPLERNIRLNENRASEAGSQTLSFGQGVAGGYFVPAAVAGLSFADRAYETMKQYDELFDDRYASIFYTDNGAHMPFPMFDDTTNNSVIVGETLQSAEVDIASFSSASLASFAFRSKVIGISIELLQDSAFPIGSIIEKVIASRHARGVGQYLATGSGLNQPTGLTTGVVASGVSATIASGSATNDGSGNTGANSIGTQDVNKLYHSLSKVYRGAAVFYGTDNTLKSLEAQLDKNGRPLVDYRHGFTDVGGLTPYIFGRPYAVCPSMPEIGAGANPLFFGDPSYFVTRRIQSASYIRRYWQNPSLVLNFLVGFEGWMRTDSNVLIANANQSPFQYIQCHS